MVEIHDCMASLPPRERWTPSARKLRDTYAITPGAPLFRKEFGFFSLERWYAGGLDPEADLAKEFFFDPPGNLYLSHLGWCEAEFVPAFEEKVIETHGDYEIVQDVAGRHILFFKGRRSGFMPEYLSHPVKDWKSWEENVKWRLDPKTPERYNDLEKRMAEAQAAAAQGLMISQNMIGGYMYLRSLIGPAELLLMFYENPELIHDCMKSWFELADAVTAACQRFVTLDEIYIAEDICYNRSSLISPDMIREFLFPYYRQLIENIRKRQLDKNRKLYIHIDTDGFSDAVIPVYREIGTNAMSPFEVAANCDVVRTGKAYPDLFIMGGIDKRVLASTREEIRSYVTSILPVMRERGGYIPTCDHGVPEEVSLDNYRYYRDLCVELGG